MSVEELRKQISNADSAQIDILLEAAFARKRELYPQWDIQYMALPKNDWEERRKIMEFMLEMETRFRKESQEMQLQKYSFCCMMCLYYEWEESP